MRYDLLNSNRGVLIDRTPLMQDIKDTFEVSFLVKPRAVYVALFTDESGTEYKEMIKDGRVKLPKQLLGKEQYVGLIVSEVDGENIVRSWECEPLRITAFLYARQTQWQVSGGQTDTGAIARLAELEKLHAETLTEFAEVKAAMSQHTRETEQTVALFKQEQIDQQEALASLKRAYASLLETAKDLSENQAILQDNIKRLSATVESLK